jgi:hypothetical protein
VAACPSTIQAAHNIEVATQVPPPPSRPNPTKKAPTPELLNTYRTINEEQINPLEGSWHLQALPRLTPDLLQSTFETMPLQEAIAMIRAVPSGYREDLANKLNLNPTLKARVLASSNEKRLRPKSQLKILGLQKV